MSLRPCLEPRCPVLVPSGRCEAHGGPGQPWQAKRQPETPRLRGRANQRARAVLFAQSPLCAECQRQGRTSIATVRDHVVPLAEGGREHPDNEQGLCLDCHNQKTAAESARGVARGRWHGM
jgi:5-methylcytosine-specific restriction protein A